MNVVVTVDRIEGDCAVLIVGKDAFDWPIEALPGGAREGSRYAFEITEVAADQAEAEARLARLRAKSPQDGDIDL